MDLSDDWGPIRARTKAWVGALLTGASALGWLWAGVRFSSLFAELATQLAPMAFNLLVASVFMFGAAIGYAMLRPASTSPRSILPRGELRRLMSEEIPVRDEVHDTEPDLPAARRPKPRASSSPTVLDLQDRKPARPSTPPTPVEDDKEYF